MLQPLHLPYPVTILFPALSRTPSPNSTASFLPQTPYRPISALTSPPFLFLFLPSAINCIQDYYYLILSLLYICIGVSFFLYVLLLLSSILCCKASWGNYISNRIEHKWIVSVTNWTSYEHICTPLFTVSVMNRNLNRSERVQTLMNRDSYLYINNIFLIWYTLLWLSIKWYLYFYYIWQLKTDRIISRRNFYNFICNTYLYSTFFTGCVNFRPIKLPFSFKIGKLFLATFIHKMENWNQHLDTVQTISTDWLQVVA